MDVLIIDNNDSFTRNLEQLIIAVSGGTTEVAEYSRIPVLDIFSYDHIFISPGPGHPKEYPVYRFIKEINTPVTGICLGMQVINEIFGGKTGRLGRGIHGKTLPFEYNGETRQTARYHSLYCSEVSDCFNITYDCSSVPMIISHKQKQITGIQFHPESFMTEKGEEYIEYVLRRIPQGAPLS
ncbi:aminodeoxychorismate/anthranilate synthase component II [Limisalsivibrio acetivorans]|uniref:aminodeoxychorismate/anthranilate synthase component II n=1 Tax=Limisalsivibrio acetivorans TaxID=1304888 RepID=UPI0003B45012|nr:aminodeoxychorismate/anthranilate synthase component II [Limisalsivibrio acetivorans]